MTRRTPEEAKAAAKARYLLRRAAETPEERAVRLAKSKSYRSTPEAKEARRVYMQDWWARHPGLNIEYKRRSDAKLTPEQKVARRAHEAALERARYVPHPRIRKPRPSRAKPPAERLIVTAPVAHIRAAVMSDAIYRAVWAALAGIKSYDLREEIASEAVILLLDGTVSCPKEAARLGAKRHWSLFSKFDTISLDEHDGFLASIADPASLEMAHER